TSASDLRKGEKFEPPSSKSPLSGHASPFGQRHREVKRKYRISVMVREPILSRHRLPQTYRLSLAALWTTPVLLLLLTVFIIGRSVVFMFDPRLWLPVALMLIPAIYIWREGVDVLPSGIIRRVHWPRYYPYGQLDNWYFDKRPDRH